MCLLCFRSTYNGIERSSPSHHPINLVLLFGIFSLLTSVERSLWCEISESSMANINMQQIKFNYSLKNIGLTSKDVYTISLINKTQRVIQRMRWKAHLFLNQASNDTKQDRANTNGLKSKLSAPPVAELRAFDDDVARLIENVKFRDMNNEFMKELERDKKKVKSSTNIFVPADKARNYCEMLTQVITRDCSRKMSPNPTNTHKNTSPQIAQKNSRTSSTN